MRVVPICCHAPLMAVSNSRESNIVDQEIKPLIRIWLAPQLDEGQDIGKVLLLFSRSYVLNYDSYWSEVA